MAEAKTSILPFAAGALHTNALAASNDAALREGGAEYYGLQQVILDIGRSILSPGSRVIDLRCDIGTLMPLIAEHEDLCRFVVLSPTAEESWKCFDKLRTRVRFGFVDAACLDLRVSFPELSARMIIAKDALSDLSEERLSEVMVSIRRRLERNGAALVVEDVPDDADESAPARKKRRGRSADEWESLFKRTGFSSITIVWSDGEKVAWLIRK
ncbi:MAG: hypothetical protein LUQ09_04885 [Methanomassiliicoccales archaeon]|nr:hypothetical protein [Methanomassiliicoccales archaeon]